MSNNKSESLKEIIDKIGVLLNCGDKPIMEYPQVLQYLIKRYGIERFKEMGAVSATKYWTEIHNKKD